MADPRERETRIRQWIPRFIAYSRHEHRRMADEAFREYLVERIEHFARCSSNLLLECGPGRPREELGPILASMRENLLNLGDSLRSAPYAFSEFMTSPRLEDDVVGGFYAHDERIIERVHAIQSQIEPTLSEATDIPSLARRLAMDAQTLIALCIERQEAISNFPASSEPRLTQPDP